jgi:hypothetical protein
MATVPEALDQEREYPESWLWDEDGDHVAGRFVKFDRASTRDYGMKAILVLDVDGTKRSIWLTATVLHNKLRDEVAGRPGRNLNPGERVSIRRLDRTPGEGGRQGYWRFQVLFPDRPELTAADVFELDEATAEAESERPGVRQDDDIPF